MNLIFEDIPTAFITVDNIKVRASEIYNFLNEACDFVDTIGKSENWTDEYLYFTNNEKELEKLLLKLDVIIPMKKNAVNKYWLTINYHSFVTAFYDLMGHS